MTSFIVYHQVKPGTDCPDGIMAAAIATMAIHGAELFGDSYRSESDYGPEPEANIYPFRPGDELTIVDFSYPARWLQHWEDAGIRVKVIDHHEQRFGMLSAFSGAILDANECGATLTWKHFFPDRPMPELLLHVRRRDIGADGYYEGQCSDSEAITEGLSAFRRSAVADNPESKYRHTVAHALRLLLRNRNATTIMYDLGRPLIAERDRLVDQAVSRHVLSYLNVMEQGRKYHVPFVQTFPGEDRVSSQVGNRLAKMYPAHDFAWVKTSDGRNHLRSTGFNVAEIAAALGGGGHPRAAGF